jgi:hypothetical protein
MKATITRTIFVTALGFAFTASTALAATSYQAESRNHSGHGYDQRDQLETLASELAEATQGLQHVAVRFAAHDTDHGDRHEAKALAALEALDTCALRFRRELGRHDDDGYRLREDSRRLREDYRLLLSTYRKAAYTQHYLHRLDHTGDRFEAVTELVYELRRAYDRTYGEAEHDSQPGNDDYEARFGFRVQLPSWAWNRFPAELR